MAPTLEQLGIDKLSVEDRLKLIDSIWESIAEDPEDFEISEWQWNIVENRLAAHRASHKKGTTWENVYARLKAKRPLAYELH